MVLAFNVGLWGVTKSFGREMTQIVRCLSALPQGVVIFPWPRACGCFGFSADGRVRPLFLMSTIYKYISHAALID